MGYGWQPAHHCTFLYGNGNANYNFGTGFLVHMGIISEVKRVEFINDRISYITLRGHSCDNVVLNVHVQAENKRDDMKDRFTRN
jgi:hypothetical protein